VTATIERRAPLSEIRNHLILRPAVADARSASVDPVICVGVQSDGTAITVRDRSVQLSVRGSANRLEERSGRRLQGRMPESLPLYAGDRIEITRKGSRVSVELTSNSVFREDEQGRSHCVAMPDAAQTEQ
jgi:hypothetical protein